MSLPQRCDIDDGFEVRAVGVGHRSPFGVGREITARVLIVSSSSSGSWLLSCVESVGVLLLLLEWSWWDNVPMTNLDVFFVTVSRGVCVVLQDGSLVVDGVHHGFEMLSVETLKKKRQVLEACSLNIFHEMK
jgi:hypothetical protein